VGAQTAKTRSSPNGTNSADGWSRQVSSRRGRMRGSVSELSERLSG
jgi:hypothetical protein